MDLRYRLWCVLAVIALVAGGVAFAQRPATYPTQAPEPQPLPLPQHLPLHAARV